MCLNRKRNNLTATAKAAKRDWICLCGIQAAYWSVCTMQTSFLVSYLTNNGYSSTFTANIVFMMSVVNLIAQPMWGYLADTKIGLKNVIICCMGVSVFAIALIPAAIACVPFLVILTAMYGFFTNPMQGLTDAITNITATRNKYVVYGFTRGCGSLAAAVSSLFFGKLVSITGLESLFLINATLCLVAMLLMIFFRSVAYKEEQESLKTIEVGEEKITICDSAKILLKNRKFMFLLISITLLNVPSRLASLYTPIQISKMGGGSTQLGLAMFLNCILMAPCMVLHSYLIRKRIRNNVPLLASALFTAIRIYSMGVAHSLDTFLAVQILQSFSYGLMQPATVQAVSEVTPLALRSTAITLATAVQVVFSTLIGNNLSSIIEEKMGFQFVCFGSAAIVFIGIAFYLPVCLNKD